MKVGPELEGGIAPRALAGWDAETDRADARNATQGGCGPCISPRQSLLQSRLKETRGQLRAGTYGESADSAG